MIRVWDINTGKPTFTHKIKSPAYCIAFAADGKSVITGHNNHLAMVTALGK
jgi:hypothetical protein